MGCPRHGPAAMRAPAGRPLAQRGALLVFFGTALLAAPPVLLLPTAAPWSPAFAAALSGASVVAAPPLGRPTSALLAAARVARRAEAEIVDVEPEEEKTEEAQPITSVFDGPKRDTFNQLFNGKWYKVTKANWTYEVKNKDGEVESGNWARAWNMPEKDFKRREKSLRQRWRAKKRKLRIKHGMGEKWPNGKYIFLAKLQGSPFTRERYGEKYVGHAAWHFSANEIPARERQMRAFALKRRLEQEAEEKRIDRLRELGVWPGEQSWRRPWQPKVDLTPPELQRRTQR